MTIKKEAADLLCDMQEVRQKLEHIVEVYLEEYADYGWDSFSETIANVTAQVFMEEMILKNAEVKKDVYR